MVVLVSFLQHRSFLVVVKVVLDFSVNSFFWALGLDILFINITKQETSDLNLLKWL